MCQDDNYLAWCCLTTNESRRFREWPSQSDISITAIWETKVPISKTCISSGSTLVGGDSIVNEYTPSNDWLNRPYHISFFVYPQFVNHLSPWYPHDIHMISPFNDHIPMLKHAKSLSVDDYPLVIKHGVLEHGLFLVMFLFESSIHFGDFPAILRVNQRFKQQFLHRLPGAPVVSAGQRLALSLHAKSPASGRAIRREDPEEVVGFTRGFQRFRICSKAFYLWKA